MQIDDGISGFEAVQHELPPLQWVTGVYPGYTLKAGRSPCVAHSTQLHLEPMSHSERCNVVAIGLSWVCVRILPKV